MGRISRGAAGAVVLGALIATAGCRQKASAGPRFYYDLGPDSLDVSDYPPGIRDGYAVFRGKCAACHTLARPLNSPYDNERDWDRYLKAMAYRGSLVGQMTLTAEETASIRAFLVYDMQVRKIKGREEFLKDQQELRRRFDELSPKP